MRDSALPYKFKFAIPSIPADCVPHHINQVPASICALANPHSLLIDDSMSLDVTSKFQDAYRSFARGGAVTPYTCPICNEPSNAGFKLWEHAKQAHPDSPEVAGYTERAEAKDLFLDKAYVGPRMTRLHRRTQLGCSLASFKSDLLTLRQVGRIRPTRLKIADPHRNCLPSAYQSRRKTRRKD